jgi:hypothetical protein
MESKYVTIISNIKLKNMYKKGPLYYIFILRKIFRRGTFLSTAIICLYLRRAAVSSPVWSRSDSEILKTYYKNLGTAVAQWLRCCATNRKVAGSIPDGVSGIFHWHNPSDRTMALGSTHPLTEMSLTTILCRCQENGNLNFLESSGPLQACNGTALPITIKKI